MTRETKQFIRSAELALLDSLTIFVSFWIAYYLRFSGKILPVVYGLPPKFEYLKLVVVIVVIWVYVFRHFGLYQPGRRASEFTPLLKAVTTGLIILMALTFLYRSVSYSRAFFAFAWFVNLAGLTVARRFWHLIEKKMHYRGKGLVRILIVGAGKIGQMAAEKMFAQKELGYAVIGYLDDALPQGSNVNNVQVLGNTSMLSEIILSQDVDEVVIALPARVRDKILGLTLECETAYVRCQVVPDMFELIEGKVDVSTIAGLPLVSLKRIPLRGWNLVIKRVIDFIGSILFIIIGLPVFVVCAMLVKLSSSGPLLYVQERIGRDGRKFRMFKFRSMRVNAEKTSGPVWAAENDPRITKAGAFLRRFSLDELPQLFNVLRGDMSLVGPRPEREHFVQQFNQTIERYFIRHKVKSGLTGWAQINDLRGNTSIDERTKYDLYYVENWSIWFDFRILIVTLEKIFFSRHAY